MNIRGFTLLEVVIAVGILAVLSILTATSIQNSVRDKKRIQENIDHTSTIRSAFKVIERDIQMAFHFRDLNKEVYEEIKKNQQKNKKPGNNDSQNEQIVNQVVNQKELTQFVGENEQLHLTSLNNTRMFANSRESDQMEVGYYLADCRKLGAPDKTSTCVWRRSTPVIDDDVTEGGTARVLLEGVINLKFRYYDIEREEWIEVWKSNEGGDAATQGKFPLAVEVTLETEMNKKKRKLSSVIPLRHPNNKKKEEPQPNQPGTDPQGGNP